jgi:Zn-dependent M28 family amino/carboxypeptidase
VAKSSEHHNGAYGAAVDSSKSAPVARALTRYPDATMTIATKSRKTEHVLLLSLSLVGVAALAACAVDVAEGTVTPAPEPAAPAVEPPAPEASAGPVYVLELRALGLADAQAHALLTELCTLAPHRLAGSEGAARAVEWGRATMERLGFANVRLEPVRVPRWERGSVSELVVVEPAAHAGERLSVLALGGSEPTLAGGLEGEVLAVSSFEELKARAAEAAGKLVLFRRPMNAALAEPFEAYGGAVNQRSSGAIEAARVGGVGALVRSMTMARDDAPHTGQMRYAEGVARVPAAAVSTLACERIEAWLAAGERVRLRLALDCRTLPDVDSANVVGEIPGRERPEEVVLIGAHLDAWDIGDGAHDDGAGCAHVLEAGRLLLASPLGPPRRTVRCVLFMNEENGLRGALAYRDTNAAELERHVLAIESDRGGGLPLGYATDASGAAAELLARLYGGRPLARGGGADISPLAEFGVPLVGFYPNPQRYFDYHHSANDVLASVHPRELQLGAIALASMAWLAAEHPEDWPRELPAPSGR